MLLMKIAFFSLLIIRNLTGLNSLSYLPKPVRFAFDIIDENSIIFSLLIISNLTGLNSLSYLPKPVRFVFDIIDENSIFSHFDF
jgi:hypothetical protein